MYADTEDCMAKSRRFEAMQEVERSRTPKPSVQGSIYNESWEKGVFFFCPGNRWLVF